MNTVLSLLLVKLLLYNPVDTSAPCYSCSWCATGICKCTTALSANLKPLPIISTYSGSVIKHHLNQLPFPDLLKDQLVSPFCSPVYPLWQPPLNDDRQDSWELTNNIIARLDTATNRFFRKGILDISAGVFPPLIVLDYYPFEGNPADINPKHIKSIKIVKDAPVTGANGIIVITTKKHWRKKKHKGKGKNPGSKKAEEE